MVVIIKKKIQKPPEGYEFEKIPHQLRPEDFRLYNNVTTGSEINRKSAPLYPVAWGWNSNGRAGNMTKDELREPGHVQRTVHSRFIACSAGMHHSLLVSDAGNVFAFGEGRAGQLGFGNPITINPIKGGIIQTCPKQINPSGNYKYKKDFRIVEVSCGGYFSIAREITEDEGVALCEGLPELEILLIFLRNFFMESPSIQRVWAIIRQERFRIGLHCGGHLISWGTGGRGELGLGKYLTSIPYPRNIWKLKYICITSISAGTQHVLAITSTKHLFSWGNGQFGRLGHGDYYDRYVPTIVEFFENFLVEQCSAGDSHSAVLTTARKSTVANQERRVATFGRGAYGRLGAGNLKNAYLPVAVTQWFPSIAGYKFRQVACGGAHTLLLAVGEEEKTLANPWGIRTIIAAWGYGGNGQLGTGYTTLSLIPVKVRIPRWEVVSEISAGRSWSMAKTIAGDLYTWGKGLRGVIK